MKKTDVGEIINVALGRVYQTVLTKLNTEIANEGPDNTFWLLSLISDAYPMNMTNTKAPLIDHALDLIEVHFDGRFIDVADETK
jgi:hypothetical protein